MFLFTLLTIALVAVGGIVWNWYDTGMDREHTEDVDYAEFGRLLHSDHAFQNIELLVSRKHIFLMRGSVATNADRDRLRLLAAQYHIRWNEEVEVGMKKGR